MLIIFDCDGVLVDSEAIANQVLRRHLLNLGLSLSETEVNEHFRGISMAAVLNKISEQFCVSLPDDFEAALQAETFALFATQLQPVAGITEVLNQLQLRGVPCCVASSGSYEKMAVTLTCTDLKKYFPNAIFSAVDVVKGKPAPDLFLYAAAKMGVSPVNCVVVEDALPGVQAGVAAGMRVLGYCEPNAPPDHWQRLSDAGAECFSSMHYLLQQLPISL